jgi:predicted outer membrane protein
MSLLSRFYFTAALGASLLVTPQLLAQQTTAPREQQQNQPRTQQAQPAQPGQPGQRPQAQPGQRADAQLAACLVIANEGEVAVAKLAQQRASNPQVKRFAEQMIEDHGQMLQKLQRIAGAQAGQRSAEGQPDQPRTNRPAEGQANRPNQPERDRPAVSAEAARQAGSAMRGGSIDFVALKRELAQQCLETTRKELGSKEGKEFDRCYMGMAIMKHMEAIDTMKVFKNHASPEFAQALDGGIRTATTHLEHAKEIAKQLEGDAASTARREK